MTISKRAIIAAAIATGLVALRASAQDAPASPAPATTATATATNAAAAAVEKAPATPAAPLPGEPGVSKQNNVNIRGQAKINSEVLGRLQKNEPIAIQEEVTIKKPKQDEPARWYRIALPASLGVWVNTSYIDADSKVKPRRLNLRGGPGENYSIVGRLEKGALVKKLETKEEWTKIETPTNAYGFVAAHLVDRTPAPAIAATPAKVETPTPTPPPVVAEVTPTPATTPAAKDPVVPSTTAPPAAATTPAPVVTPAPAEPVDAPIEKVKKVVTREGLLRNSVSIQAPSYFELRSLDTDKTINYVFSTNLVLKQYKGKRILVTGEEVLDERWQNTPVLVVDSLQIVP
jgi:SH3-like domain-containing protein